MKHLEQSTTILYNFMNGDLEEGGWSRGDFGWRKGSGGRGWRMIKYGFSIMYHVEHNTNTGFNVMNDDVEKGGCSRGSWGVVLGSTADGREVY